MDEKTYGVPDPDTTLVDAVRKFAEGKGDSLLIAYHQRVELGAKQCQHPGSLLIDFCVGGVYYAARQHYNGRIECPLKG